jgi:hypothetical protein
MLLQIHTRTTTIRTEKMAAHTTVLQQVYGSINAPKEQRSITAVSPQRQHSNTLTTAITAAKRTTKDL